MGAYMRNGPARLSRRGLLAAGVALGVAPLPAAAQAGVPLKLFADDPAMRHAVLSPDGSKVAFVQTLGDGRVAVVATGVSGGDRKAVDVTPLKIRDIYWAADDLVMIVYSFTDRAGPIAFFGNEREFVFPTGFDLRTGKLIDIAADLIEDDGDGVVRRGLARPDMMFPDGSMLITLGQITNNRLSRDLVRYNPRTRARVTVEQGGADTAHWILGDGGAVVARIDEAEVRGNVRLSHWELLVPEGRGWRSLIAHQTEEAPFDDWALSTDGLSLLATGRNGQDRNALWKIDLKTGAVSGPLVEDAVFDIDWVISDPNTLRGVGAGALREGAVQTFVDPDLAAVATRLKGGFPGQVVEMQSWSRDRNRFLVTARAPGQPETYYLYDHAQGAMGELGPTVAPAASGGLVRTRFDYRSRDGVPLWSVVTAPKGAGAGAPIVALPHGGPHGRDSLDYDWLAAAIASRGYVVVQPQFRGSSGQGLAFRKAGYRQWNGVMRTDIEDAVDALAAAGRGDKARASIVGASFGGYAALAGVAFAPERWRCAVAIAPLSDLQLWYVSVTKGRESTAWTAAFFNDRIADTSGDALAALSPAKAASAIKAPVLLIHGEDDSVVPIIQSRGMERAVKSAGGRASYIALKNEDHWLSRPATRLQLLESLIAFLTTESPPG